MSSEAESHENPSTSKAPSKGLANDPLDNDVSVSDEADHDSIFQELEVIPGTALITGATEEVHHTFEDDVEHEDYEYDPMAVDHHQVAVYELYQPQEIEDGRLTCRICAEAGSSPYFESRAQYAQHRYKFHGTFMHVLPCAASNCRETFPSLPALKKHLLSAHHVPIETHYKHFNSMAQFDSWRLMLEMATECRFVLHNRQPHLRRQVMHCASSEHVTCTSARRARQRRSKMNKDGACCPAHISYVVQQNGTVDVVYQMVHYGHPTKVLDEATQKDDTPAENRLADLPIFPDRPRLPTSAGMQYVHLSLMEMGDAVYPGSATLSRVLLVSCLQSRFLFCRPLPSSDSTAKSLLVRQLVDIFSHFGTPLGYAAPSHCAAIPEAMDVIEHVFSINILRIGSSMPDYAPLRRAILERSQAELQSRDRWPEVIPFVVYGHNTTAARMQQPSPYELMFGRRPTTSLDMEEIANEQQPLESNGMGMHSYAVGDHVYVRGFDAVGGGGSDKFWSGVLAEVSLHSSPHFPYRVLLTDEDEEPSADSPSLWVTASDLSPTAVELRLHREEQRKEMLSSMLCGCGGGTADSAGRCSLFRAALCVNSMSRVCCAKSGLQCLYHHDYSLGAGDTYKRLQMLSRKCTEKLRAKRLMEGKRRELGVGVRGKRREGEEEADEREERREEEAEREGEIVRVDDGGGRGTTPAKPEPLSPEKQSPSRRVEEAEAGSASRGGEETEKDAILPSNRKRRHVEILESSLIVEEQELTVERVREVEQGVEAAPVRRGILSRRGPHVPAKAVTVEEESGDAGNERRKSTRSSKPNKFYQRDFI